MFSLEQNYPNPFNPSTKFKISVPEKSSIEVTVFDISGRRIKTLYNGEAEQGSYFISWDGRDESGKKVPSGVYIYNMKTAQFQQSKRMFMLK